MKETSTHRVIGPIATTRDPAELALFNNQAGDVDERYAAFRGGDRWPNTFLFHVIDDASKALGFLALKVVEQHLPAHGSSSERLHIFVTIEFLHVNSDVGEMSLDLLLFQHVRDLLAHRLISAKANHVGSCDIECSVDVGFLSDKSEAIMVQMNEVMEPLCRDIAVLYDGGTGK